MASPVQEDPATEPPPRPEVVGNAFVGQYYQILHQSPEDVHKFYQDTSKLGRPDDSGIMGTVSTMEAINEKILSLGYGVSGAEIKTVDAQDSHGNGVIVLVTGQMTGKDDLKRNFTQTFFLAPQDPGYFVLNDVFRCIDDSDPPIVTEVEAPLTPDQEKPPAHESTEETPIPNAGVNQKENEKEQEAEEGEEAEAEEEEEKESVHVNASTEHEAAAAPSSELEVVEPPEVHQEDPPKQSYAAIVKVMSASGMNMSSAVVAPRPAQKIPEPQPPASAAAPPATDPTGANPVPAADNGNASYEAKRFSIYVKGLPMTATVSQLKNEFERFGPIKQNGIQVRSNKGFCFGFVEFEVPHAVQSAIEGSPVVINGWNVVVEEKLSTNSRVNRPRFPGGMRVGGYRPMGGGGGDGRGRGGYGNVRGYGRGDYNRMDFGGRNGNGRVGVGGYVPARIEGYPPMNGGGGPRPHRPPGGAGIGANGRGMPTRVPASA